MWPTRTTRHRPGGDRADLGGRGHWYSAGMHPRHPGALAAQQNSVLNRAIGHGWGMRPPTRPTRRRGARAHHDALLAYSAAKAISTTVAHAGRTGRLRSRRPGLRITCPPTPGTARNAPRFATSSRTAPVSRSPPDHGWTSNGWTTATTPARCWADAQCTRRVGPHLSRRRYLGPLVREIVLAATGRNIREILATGDPRSARLPVDELRCGRSRSAAGRAPATPPESRCLHRLRGRSSWRSAEPCTDNSVHQHPGVPDQCGAVVEHRLQRRRAVPICRNPLPRGELDGLRIMRPETLAAATAPARRLRARYRHRLDADALGHRYMLGSKAFGPSAENAVDAFRAHRAGRYCRGADPSRRLSAAVVSSGKPAGTPRRIATRTCSTASTRDPASALGAAQLHHLRAAAGGHPTPATTRGGRGPKSLARPFATAWPAD